MLLDSHDVYLMSRAKFPHSSKPTAALHGEYPDATRSQYGLFDVAALSTPARTSLPVACGNHSSGIAPVLFLSARPLPPTERAPSNAGVGEPGGGTRRRRRGAAARHKAAPQLQESVCWFASKHDSTSAVHCTLGKHAMPAACALYPLGELWSGGIDSGSPSDQRADSGLPWSFYTLDASGRCEGVDHTQADSRSVTEYRESNDLRSRKQQWDWFQQVCYGVAVCPTLHGELTVAQPVCRFVARH